MWLKPSLCEKWHLVFLIYLSLVPIMIHYRFWEHHQNEDSFVGHLRRSVWFILSESPWVLTSCHMPLCYIHLHTSSFRTCNKEWFLALQVVSPLIIQLGQSVWKPPSRPEMRKNWQSHRHVIMFSYPVSLNSNFGYKRYYTVRSYWPCHSVVGAAHIRKGGRGEAKNNKKHISSFLQLINMSFSSLKSYSLTKAVFALDVMFYSNSLRIRHE